MSGGNGELQVGIMDDVMTSGLELSVRALGKQRQTNCAPGRPGRPPSHPRRPPGLQAICSGVLLPPHALATRGFNFPPADVSLP